MTEDSFNKRIFTAHSFFRSGFRVFISIPGIIHAYFFNGLDKRFSERLLLAVSGVNGCVYCSWFHSYMATRRGVSQVEIDQLLSQLIPGDIPELEHQALLFAIHYAERDGQLDAGSLESLHGYFKPAEVRQIIALISAIHFGNLCGNTFDAFLLRLKGKPVVKSGALLEFFVFLISAPFLLPLLGRVAGTQ